MHGTPNIFQPACPWPACSILPCPSPVPQPPLPAAEQGRDLERTVLAKAVRWHLQDRVIVHGNKTVVFE